MLKYLTIIASLVLIISGLYWPAIAADDPEAKARRLINALGCKGCHKIEGSGGSLAPDLDNIGSRLTQQQIEDHMAAHAASRKKGFMPSYGTTPRNELQNLSIFLYNLR